MSNGWIGVDLDRTLAHYDHYTGPEPGEPLMPMVNRVKRWLTEGKDVRIVTARASHPAYDLRQKVAIEFWCAKHLGEILPITCIKDYEMLELWDDRAVQMIPNTGISLQEMVEAEQGLKCQQQHGELTTEANSPGISMKLQDDPQGSASGSSLPVARMLRNTAKP